MAVNAAKVEDTAVLQTAATSLLKVDDYGWDPLLFKDQHQISFCLCTHCNSVCRNPAELGCNHNDDDIHLYCNDCLQLLIQDADGKCPINAHPKPSVHLNRATRGQIAQSIVICPYSSKYKMLKQAQHNDVHQTIDTIGNDQKEGLIPNESDVGCSWNGTLKELINKHMVACTKMNNPLLVSQIRMKELHDKYIELDQKHRETTQSLQNKVAQLQEALDSTKRVLNDKHVEVERSQQQVVILQTQLKSKEDQTLATALQISMLQTERDDAMNALREMEQNSQLKSNEDQESSTKMDTLLAERDKAEKEMQRKQSKVFELMERVNELMQQNHELMQQNVQLHSKVHELNKLRLQEKVEKVEDESETLKLSETVKRLQKEAQEKDTIV
eukprot:1031204_1